MADVPNISHIKPLWPTRHEDKPGDQDTRDESDSNNETPESEVKDDKKPHKSDYDGQIDEYV